MITLIILLAGLQVHEWGVIMQSPNLLTSFTPQVFEENTNSTNELSSELEDRAPVMYFHGDTCSVQIRISIPDGGYLTTTLPVPDEGGVNSTYLVWNKLHLLNSPPGNLEEGWQSCEYLNYDIEPWRNVEALTVQYNGRFDKFVYYDCVPGSSGDLPFISTSGNQSFRMPYGEIPCLILTVSGEQLMYGEFTLADIISSIPKGLQFLEDSNQLRREIRRWSEGILNEDEFNSFWNCWETELLTVPYNQVMILYKVPDEIINHIASIEVTPNREMEVEINRFILAFLPYRTQ